ncbi:hypothetical protein ACS0TY_004313 [Phlomoides rotata]
MSHTRKLGQKRRGSRESSSALQDQQVYGGSFRFGAEIGVGSGGAYSEINEKLSSNVEELNKLPRSLTSVAEALTAFMHVLLENVLIESSTVQYFLHVFGAAKELLRGKFDEYPDVHEMYCTARLADMLDDYSK